MISNFTDPQKNLISLPLRPGSIVADFGAGAGHYVFLLADMVGDDGKVYAVDIQKDLLGKIQSEASSRGLDMVETIWGDVENVGGTKLRAGLLDAVVASNILFQVDSKPGFVHECNRVLKPGGRVLLIDWSESFGGLGPQPGSVVDMETAKRLFEQGGFVFEKDVPAGAHHYGCVFKKTA